MRAGPLKCYIAVVEDAGGLTYKYVVHAKRRSDAEKEVRQAGSQWGVTLVEVRPAIDRWKGTLRPRPSRIVVGITIAVTTVTAIMIVGAHVTNVV